MGAKAIARDGTGSGLHVILVLINQSLQTELLIRGSQSHPKWYFTQLLCFKCLCVCLSICLDLIFSSIMFLLFILFCPMDFQHY